MCSPNVEYHLVNPTTQVALFSECIDKCISLENITWNIHQGVMNSSDVVQWTPFNGTYYPHDDRFFGKYDYLIIKYIE
jgi:hypothetical protein